MMTKSLKISWRKSRNLHAKMVGKKGKTKMTMGRRDKKRTTDNRTPGEGKIFGLLLLFRRRAAAATVTTK